MHRMFNNTLKYWYRIEICSLLSRLEMSKKKMHFCQLKNFQPGVSEFCASHLRYILLIGGECVTCCWSKLTISLGKQQRELLTCVLFETAANLCVNRCQPNNFSHFFFYFWVGRYNKTLNDSLLWKQWVLFPFNLNVPHGFTSGNIEGLGETKLTVSLGASH